MAPDGTGWNAPWMEAGGLPPARVKGTDMRLRMTAASVAGLSLLAAGIAMTGPAAAGTAVAATTRAAAPAATVAAESGYIDTEPGGEVYDSQGGTPSVMSATQRASPWIPLRAAVSSPPRWTSAGSRLTRVTARSCVSSGAMTRLSSECGGH